MRQTDSRKCPDLQTLRALCAEHPAYRLLVRYLDCFPLELSATLGRLPRPLQEVVQAARQESEKIDPRASSAGRKSAGGAPRRQVPAEATPEERARFWAGQAG